MIVGLVLGAASVISLVTHWRDAGDGAWGVFGIFAADNWTTLLWGASAAYLLISALLPRVGGKDKDKDRDRDRDMTRNRPVERERVVEREPRVEREPTMTDARPANVVDREVVGRDDRDSINEPTERGGRFNREERITERTSGTGGTTGGGAVSPRRSDERL